MIQPFLPNLEDEAIWESEWLTNNGLLYRRFEEEFYEYPEERFVALSIKRIMALIKTSG